MNLYSKSSIHREAIRKTQLQEFQDPIFDFDEEFSQISYPSVQVLLTNKGEAGTYKWTDCKIQGTLQLVKVNYKDMQKGNFSLPPIVKIRLISQEIPFSTLIEYEVPLNVRFQPQLSDRHCAIQTVKGNWIGLLFNAESDRLQFEKEFEVILKQLQYDESQIEEIKIIATISLNDRIADNLAEVVDQDKLFDNSNPTEQNIQLERLLRLAGFDIEVDLQDPDTFSLIQNVLENFKHE